MKYILFLVLFLSPLILFSQNAIIFPGNQMTISWNTVDTDTNGKLEDSVYYELRLCKFIDSTDINTWILQDTIMFVDVSQLQPTYYTYRVRAIDRAENFSDWLWSHDCQKNDFGCWIFGRDIIPPMRIKRFRYGDLIGYKTCKYKRI